MRIRPSSFATLSVMVIAFSAISDRALADEVTLTKDEADTVKLIMTKDKMMQGLAKGSLGLDALNRLLTLKVTGPVKLALEWNQAAFTGWRKANAALVPIEKTAVCHDIELQIAGGTPNERFFEQLAQARGCND